MGGLVRQNNAHSLPTAMSTTVPPPKNPQDVGSLHVQHYDPNDIEAMKQRARAARKQVQSKPLDNIPNIAETTGRHRSRRMEKWHLFVEESMQKFVVLGPEEYVWRRTVNSASSATQCWRELIAQVDANILNDKRREDPAKYNHWRLRFMSHTHQRAQGPVFEISRWIFQELAVELSLSTTLTFDKIQVTAEDIYVLLNTLYERADDIPCQPRTRLGYHGIVTLAGIGGFRISTILTLKYRDVSLALVRDPDDRSRAKLVLTLTIAKNKLRRATRVTRAKDISFSITFVEFNLICLASIIASCAIYDDAFEAGFESVEALLSRPDLEDVDFLLSKWKSEMLDRPIFKLSKHTFYNIWHRNALVSGFRHDPRFYATRVGAAGRLDGVLTDAARNSLLSHSTAKKVGPNPNLFQTLRNISLSRDLGAPIFPSKEDLQSFERRNDVTKCRASLEVEKKTGTVQDINSTKSSIETLISTLSNLKIQEKRTEYFNCVDDLRARGLSTKDCASTFTAENPSQRKPNQGTATAIAYHFKTCAGDVDEWSSTEERSKCYMVLLVNYLSRRSQPSLTREAKITNLGSDSLDQHSHNEVGKHGRKCWKRSLCLLCGDGKSYSCRGRTELTRHYQRVHIKYGTFYQPFPCPQCDREGLEEAIIEGGPSAWSHHAEELHGKYYTPYLPSDLPSSADSLRCLFCDNSFTTRGFKRHVNHAHVQKEAIFQKPFPCPECSRQEKEDAMINGEEEWYRHVGLFHGEPKEENHRSLDSGKRGKDEEDAEMLETEAPTVAWDGWVAVENERAASDDEWLDDAIADTAITTPDFFTDSTPSSQSSTTSGAESPTTPMSSQTFDDIRNLDPRMMADELGKGWKRTKGFEDPHLHRRRQL
ncbi:hypothetical protein MMC29_004061 [Sticta canariensis]|nr:hypothetical protein [Sticta canariensis]